VLHSASRHGGAFTLRVEVSQDRLSIEVEDGGGPWRDGPRDDGRPHGFDVVAAIAGAGNWGIDGDARGRVAWARLGGGDPRGRPAPARGRRAGLPFPGRPAAVVHLLGQEVWPVACRGGRPDSDLYAESSDA